MKKMMSRRRRARRPGADVLALPFDLLRCGALLIDVSKCRGSDVCEVTVHAITALQAQQAQETK